MEGGINMEGIIHFETFLITGILLNLTPRNDTFFILGRSIALGKKAGLLSVLGIGTGSLIHTTLAAFGLSIIIAQSVWAFTVIKYAGAVYLVYMGFKMIVSPSHTTKNTAQSESSSYFKNVYRDAVFTNVLNPKVAMFFIAFLPQFIDPAYRHDVLPFLTLGLTFTITGTIWCTMLAVFSSAISSALRKNEKFSSVLNKTCGFILVALGIKVAMTRH
ncbi:MAG: LysE family translocator [Ferruginibacter sp.]|nr:LysE family translocator [Ferruginibacter sp.]